MCLQFTLPPHVRGMERLLCFTHCINDMIMISKESYNTIYTYLYSFVKFTKEPSLLNLAEHTTLKTFEITTTKEKCRCNACMQ